MSDDFADPDQVRDDSSSDEDDAMYEPDVPDVKPKIAERGRSGVKRERSCDDLPNISENNRVLDLDEENRQWIEAFNREPKVEINEKLRELGLPTQFNNGVGTAKKIKKESYTCHLCGIENLNAYETMLSHVNGAPHRKKLKARGVYNVDVVSKAPAVASTKKKKVHRRLHSLIRECNEPVLGLEYLEEKLPKTDTEMPPMYFCTLCSSKGNPDGILNHIKGGKHREESIRKKYPKYSKRAMSQDLLSKLSMKYRENNSDLTVIKTIISDEQYPWPPKQAPWSVEQGGSGIAPGFAGAMNNAKPKPEGNSDHKHKEDISKDKDKYAKSKMTRLLSEELSEPTSIEEVAQYLEKANKLLQLAMKSKPKGPDGPRFSSEAEQNMVTGVVACLMYRAKTQAGFSVKEEPSAGATRKVKTEKDAPAARPRHEDRHYEPSPSTSGCSSSSLHSNGRSSSLSPSRPIKIKTEKGVDLRDKRGHRERNYDDRYDQRVDRNRDDRYPLQEDRGYDGRYSPGDHQRRHDRHSSPWDDRSRYSPRDDRSRFSPRDDRSRYSPRDDRGHYAAAHDEYDSRRPTSSSGYHRNGYHYNSGY